MTEWDLLIVSDQLKEKQTKMQKSYTKIIDALNGIKDEVSLLVGSWKGFAEEEFSDSFFKEWEESCRLAEKLGKWIAVYTMAEKAFECCEDEVSEII